MKMSNIISSCIFFLGVCLCIGDCQRKVPERTLEVDLRLGTSSKLPRGMSWVVAPPASFATWSCDKQAVLKLTFNKTTRKRAQIKMLFEDPSGFSFNIGDSRTDNGYGGDATTQDSDAEVHSLGTEIRFYGKGIYGKYVQWYGKLYSRKNFITHNVTINVADELVTADNTKEYIYINTFKTFNLNGQPDSEGPVNYDVYMGMNRVISSNYRKGTGLCRVKITWFEN